VKYTSYSLTAGNRTAPLTILALLLLAALARNPPASPLPASSRSLSFVVEAGGVEPPSEKVPSEEPTCVAGSLFSAIASETGESGDSLARLISTAGSGPKPLAYPAK
jgi:hypothetical protein